MIQTIIRFALLPLCAVVALATPANAQTGVGLKGGVMLSELAVDPDVDLFGRMTDFTAGLFVTTNGDSPIGGQVEVMYSRRGADVLDDLIGFSLGEIRFTYIDVSALLRLRAGGDARNHAYVFGGPTVGIELDAEASTFGVSEDFDAVTEDIDFGVAVGAGAELSGLVLEGRYTHGLRNVITGTDVFGVDLKHRSFSLLAGFRF